MRRASRLFVVAVLLLSLPSLPTGCLYQGTAPDYAVTTMALPAGDPEPGRHAFLELGCASCHRVAWDETMPELVATSIIAPSHFVSPRIEPVEGRLSPMADFSETMTVRQLIDVVAYLRAGGEQVAAAYRQEDLPAAAR